MPKYDFRSLVATCSLQDFYDALVPHLHGLAQSGTNLYQGPSGIGCGPGHRRLDTDSKSTVRFNWPCQRYDFPCFPAHGVSSQLSYMPQAWFCIAQSVITLPIVIEGFESYDPFQLISVYFDVIHHASWVRHYALARQGAGGSIQSNSRHLHDNRSVFGPPRTLSDRSICRCGTVWDASC